MIIRVGHLYPDYLNIYADRGNIAVLERRAAACAATSSRSSRSRLGTPLEPGAHDLLYVGGGQDREQALIAPDLAGHGEALREAVDGGAALLAVCGGYQLLGRGYRGRDGSWHAGRRRSSRTRRIAGETRHDRRRPAREHARRGAVHDDRGIREPRRPHGARPGRRAARTRRRRLRQRRRRRATRAAASARAIGTYLHGPLLPRNPWLADLLLSWALAHATGGEPEPLEPLADELEHEAHAGRGRRGPASAAAGPRGSRPYSAQRAPR